jgi:hypothetical protein
VTFVSLSGFPTLEGWSTSDEVSSLALLVDALSAGGGGGGGELACRLLLLAGLSGGESLSASFFCLLE